VSLLREIAVKYPAAPEARSRATEASLAEVTFAVPPFSACGESLTNVTVALLRYGIGHHAEYQPSGSIAKNSDFAWYSPSPEPKNSPSGASTRFLPSTLTCTRTLARISSESLTFSSSSGDGGYVPPCEPCHFWPVMR